MNIGQFAERSGVSTDTLRYYEKVGVLRRIGRNPSGHRQFEASDLDWITFVLRLKATGMPLADIRRYAELRSLGSATEGERQALLEAHALDLETRIARDRRHLASIRDKIDFYKRR